MDFIGYNPNEDLDTEEAANRYVLWCAHQLGLCQGQHPRTLGVAARAATLVWVIGAASMHLDDDIEEGREHHEHNMSVLFSHARRIERRPPEANVRALQAALMMADAWEPVGRYADKLLGAIRCAIAARIVAHLHPLQLKDDLPGEHCWALIDASIALLEEIQDADYPDYAVAPNQRIVERAGWQRASDVAQGLGGPPPSQN